MAEGRGGGREGGEGGDRGLQRAGRQMEIATAASGEYLGERQDSEANTKDDCCTNPKGGVRRFSGYRAIGSDLETE